MSDLNLRFLEFLEYLIVKKTVKDKTDFAKKSDISPSMVTEVSKGRTQVGIKIIQNSVDVFGLNPLWLLTGSGEMLLSSYNQERKRTQVVNEPSDDYKDKYISVLEELQDCKSRLLDVQTKLHETQISLRDLQDEIEGNEEEDYIPVPKKDVRNVG